MKNLSQTWYETLQQKEAKKEEMFPDTTVLKQLESGNENLRNDTNPVELITQLLSNYQGALSS
jgi:hypothetical protein